MLGNTDDGAVGCGRPCWFKESSLSIRRKHGKHDEVGRVGVQEANARWSESFHENAGVASGVGVGPFVDGRAVRAGGGVEGGEGGRAGMLKSVLLQV